MKKKGSIGLDIGTRHINIIKLSATTPGVELLDVACISSNPRQEKTEKIKELKAIVQEKGIASFPVNIGICGESVVVRYITLPKMNTKEIGEALKFEAQQYIPFKVEEVIFDYYVLGPAETDSNKIRLVLVAAKKETINELIDLLQQAGLTPNIIDLNSFALMNCFQFNNPEVNKESVTAIVNLNLDLLSINILQGASLYFTRDVYLSEATSLIARQQSAEGENLQLVLENIIREIRLSFDYYESEFEKHINTTFFSGEGIRIPSLMDMLKSKLGKEIVSWNPLQKLIINSTQFNTTELQEKSAVLAIACGLALREI
ncbi:MAG: pilus assembly protein PilM [Candidatus Omnitrophota bacterium]